MNRLFLFVVMLFLFGCDEVFDDTFYIQNNKNNEIVLIYSINDTNQTDTFFVSPNEKKQVFNAHSAGGTKQHRIPVVNVFAKFDVWSGSDLSKLDYFNDDYWIYLPTSKTTADYTMVVESKHFE